MKKKAETPEVSVTDTTKQNDYVTVAIPKVLSKNILLVLILILGAFFLGRQQVQIQNLEKAVSAQTKQTTQQNTLPQQVAPTPSGKVKSVTEKDHIRGDKNAKITLIEYSDFECPFCKRFHPTMQDLMKTYNGKIRWVYRQFPLSFHQNAQKEAEASECVNELAGNDKFWEFADRIFERTQSNGTGFALDQLGPLAAELGVDQTQFQSCLDSDKYAQHVKDDIADGTAGGVNSTPTTVIIDAKGKPQVIVGAVPIDTFKTAIDQALK